VRCRIATGRRSSTLWRPSPYTGGRAGQANALNAAGWCHARLDDHAQALAACQQALPLLKEAGDRNWEAATWDSLGYAHHHLGQHTQAVSCYRHARDVFRDLGDR
jgi:tetratricopeptide (TPR) repeat protein